MKKTYRYTVSPEFFFSSNKNNNSHRFFLPAFHRYETDSGLKHSCSLFSIALGCTQKENMKNVPFPPYRKCALPPTDPSSIPPCVSIPSLQPAAAKKRKDAEMHLIHPSSFFFFPPLLLLGVATIRVSLSSDFSSHFHTERLGSTEREREERSPFCSTLGQKGRRGRGVGAKRGRGIVTSSPSPTTTCLYRHRSLWPFDDTLPHTHTVGCMVILRKRASASAHLQDSLSSLSCYTVYTHSMWKMGKGQKLLAQHLRRTSRKIPFRSPPPLPTHCVRMGPPPPFYYYTTGPE